jgi:hypothetical protein
VQPSDMPVVRKIVSQAGRSGYRFGAIITGIVESAPFQMRTTLESARPSTTVASSGPSGATGLGPTETVTH